MAKQAGTCVIRQPLVGNQISLQIPQRAQHFPDSIHSINTIPTEAQGKKIGKLLQTCMVCHVHIVSAGTFGHRSAFSSSGHRLRNMWDTFPHIFFFMMVLSFLYAFIISPRDQKRLKVILSKWQKSARQDHDVPDNVSGWSNYGFRSLARVHLVLSPRRSTQRQAVSFGDVSSAYSDPDFSESSRNPNLLELFYSLGRHCHIHAHKH